MIAITIKSPANVELRCPRRIPMIASGGVQGSGKVPKLELGNQERKRKADG
jgi:hypothetical protein